MADPVAEGGMNEVINLSEVREAHECRKRGLPPDAVRGFVVRFRYCRSIAEADPYDPPAEPGRIEDVRQICFDFSRDDAIAARLRAAHDQTAAAHRRIA